jgi:PAS domain S-box-containing protein
VLRTATAGLLTTIALAFASDPGLAADAVSVQLRWDHQFQFAGFYAAQWQGYYEEAGVDVALRPAFTDDGVLLRAVEEVASGRAEFGIGAADILLARDRGADLVVLAGLFQRSGVMFYARAGTELLSPGDLTRLRVARRLGDLVDIELRAMLRAEGIDPSEVTPHPFRTEHGYLADLESGLVDVMPGYEIGTPYDAARRGLELVSLSPRAYGIDFYGDTLFTRRDFAEANPDLVDRFVAATLRGWDYALDHPQEIADRLAATYDPAFPLEDFEAFLEFQIAPVSELVAPYGDLVPIGHVNPQRWRLMHDQLSALGLVSGELDAESFVFDAEEFAEAEAGRWRRWLLLGIGGLIGLAGLLGAGNRGLRRSVVRATGDLEISRLQQQALIEASPDAMLIVERDGTCVTLNGRAAERLGASVEDCIGRNTFELMKPEVAEHRRARLREAIEGGRAVDFVDERDGRVLEHTLVPVSVPGSPAARCAVFVRDATEGRRQQETLRRALDHAERADRAKTRFLAAAAHDLRQPVQAAMLFYQLLPRRAGEGEGAETTRERLGICLESLQDLLRALLDISKLDSGMVSPEVGAFAVDPLLERLWMEFAPTAEARGIDLRRVPTSACARSDPTLLATMLRNLLANAMTYARGGKVLIGCRRRAGTLRLMVLDDGPGISQGEQALIFEEFYRGQQFGHDRSKGLGLGLSVVRRLADILGHAVEVRSVPGYGAAFAVTVPRADEAAADAGPAEARAPAHWAAVPSNRLIAVVDDHPDVLDSLRRYYRHIGHDVIAALDAGGAIEQLRRLRRRPDAIVADWHIASTDATGEETIREIRGAFGADIPGILLTGDTSAGIAAAAARAGLLLLQKPAGSRELAAALDHILQD